MNTIVIVVIGVVLLTLGLRWIYGVFGGLEERSQEIDEQLKKQISDLFEGGDETLIIRPNSVTIKQKESKDIIFAVRNTISDGKGHKFSYRTVLTNPEGKDASEVMSWLTGASENEITIPSGKIEYRAVAVDIPGTAPIGTYRFEVTLDADNNEGDSKANFIIRVRGE
ncbi:MAG: hypothetical protein HYS32_02345 [Candidatus Woesearchaeota archaeon]|nr:MAG: hypothetical protein HYS32_02345 [Candidatus Woesearchaeota archaeon]